MGQTGCGHSGGRYMGRIKDKRLFELLHDYFSIYLPNHRSASEHTLRSYRKAVDTFLEYLKRENSISLFDVGFNMIDRDTLQSFAMYLSDEKRCSAATCGQRLACLKSFLKFCSECDSTLAKYYLCTDGLAVRVDAGNAAIDYLSEQPDPYTEKGQRNMFFMILLYDTGARVDEILRVRICDVKTEATPTIQLFGKGKKPRRVPLALRTVSHYKKYLQRFHPDETEYSQEYVFYTTWDGEHHRMTANNVRAFMRECGQKAREYCPEIPENVHPHLFRHSRAMHLYQGGMDLTLVSQWLGHANLQTTLVYAYADTEQKRRAIELAESSNSPTQKNPSAGKYTVSDEETLKKLYGLR